MASKDSAEMKPSDQEPKKSDWDLAMEVAESENPFYPINPYDGHIDNEEKDRGQASCPSRGASQRSLTAKTAPLPCPNFSFPKRTDSRHREQQIGQASSSLMPILTSSREALGSPRAPTPQRVTFNEEPRIPSPDAILDVSMDSFEEMARANNPFDSDSEKSLPTPIHIRSKERDEEEALASRPRRHRPPTPMPMLFGGASPASSPTIELERSPGTDTGRVSSELHLVRPDTPTPGSSPVVRDFMYQNPYLGPSVDLTPPPRSLQRPYNPRGGIEVSLSRGQSLNFTSSRNRGRDVVDDSHLTMAEALRQFSSPPQSAQALSVRRGPEMHRFGTLQSVSQPTVSIVREDTGLGVLGEHPLARVSPQVVALRREQRILWTLGVGSQLGVISFSCSLAVIITDAAMVGKIYSGVAVWASVSFVWCLVTIIWLIIRVDKCCIARRRRRRTTAATRQGDNDVDLEQGRDGEEWHELQENVGGGGSRDNRLVNKQLPVANAQNVVATATMGDEQQRRQDEHWTRFAQDEGQLRRHVENLEDKLRAAEEELTQYRGTVVPGSRTVSLAQASIIGGTPSSYRTQSKRNKGKGKERDLRTAISQRALLRSTTFENNEATTMPASGTDGSIITALCAGVGAAASEPYSPLDSRSSRATPGRAAGGGDFSSLAGTSITMREARVRAAEQNEPIHLSVMPNGHIRMSSYDIMGGRIPELN